ncbi:MAG TPA: hypothetical protein VGC39_00475 [Candidatus Methylacidiphilales bacterium]
MNPQKTTSTYGALILIAVALLGAGISYHFTLQSRFASIEQKLEQNSVALQQYQIAQETGISAKTDALNTLSKEFDALQASLAPLGKATREQTDSLSEIHKQIASLEQSQQAQQDAQKKLADYASQIEKIKHDIQTQATQISAPAASSPAPVPTAAPLITPRAPATTTLLPLPPRADSAVDIRPAQSTVAESPSVRALPVAMPVALSASDPQ